LAGGNSDFCAAARAQAIDIAGTGKPSIAEIGCGEDLPNSLGRVCAPRFAPSCFWRRTRRKKCGKTNVYWNIVENRRLDDGRAVQRQVLYLGEIHTSQAAASRKAIGVFDEA
jgi:hypothetical protein